MRKREIARNMARESAIGCGTHVLLAMAGTTLIGGAAVYHGWKGKALFIVAALALFAGAVAFPASKGQRNGLKRPQKVTLRIPA
jgi:hypothetical protein